MGLTSKVLFVPFKIKNESLRGSSGHFHADEALAVYLLRVLPLYRLSTVIRTREPSTLESCHTVVDVGGEYDVARRRFDHHQRSFDTTFPGHNTKLSSAGLIYMHFGKEIISEMTKRDSRSKEVNTLYEKIYSDFIEAFDANDNGISAYPESAIKEAGVQKRFDDRGFTVASIVNRYNFSGTSKPEPEKTKEGLQAEEDSRFLKASSFVGEQFTMEVLDKSNFWLPARSMVEEAYASRRKYHASGTILVLPEGASWSDHLYNTESEHPDNSKVLYVLFPETADANSKWRVRAVSVERGGFSNRKDLPDSWKGLRDTELSDASDIPGCVFVHASGFIGGNLTFDGALQMAVKAAEM